MVLNPQETSSLTGTPQKVIPGPSPIHCGILHRRGHLCTTTSTSLIRTCASLWHEPSACMVRRRIHSRSQFTGLSGDPHPPSSQSHHCDIIHDTLKYGLDGRTPRLQKGMNLNHRLNTVFRCYLTYPDLCPERTHGCFPSRTHVCGVDHKSGNVDLLPVRHEPSGLRHVIQGHCGVVSATSMAPDEKSFFSAACSSDGVSRIGT